METDEDDDRKIIFGACSLSLTTKPTKTTKNIPKNKEQLSDKGKRDDEISWNKEISGDRTMSLNRTGGTAVAQNLQTVILDTDTQPKKKKATTQKRQKRLIGQKSTKKG